MTTTDDFLTRQLATMAPHRAILRAVECRLMSAVDRRGSVLDIGCGDGHFASIAYDSPVDVGIDLQQSELVEASERPDVYRHVARADASSLCFAEDSFDTVLSNCAIEHMPDLDAVISEVARVLRPGGTFATTLPSEHFAELLLGSTVLRRLGLKRASRRVRPVLQPHLVSLPHLLASRVGRAMVGRRVRCGATAVLLLAACPSGVRSVPLPQRPQPHHAQTHR